MAETIKMKVLKRFHYPSGPTGRDYHEGDEVEVLSERDAKALRLLRVAKDSEGEQQKQQRAKLQPREEERSVPRRGGRYERADMTVKENTEVKPMTTKTGPNPED